VLKTTRMRNTIFFPVIFITILGLQGCAEKPGNITAVNDPPSGISMQHITLNEETDSVIFLLYKRNEEVVNKSLHQVISYSFLETNMQQAKAEEKKKKAGNAKNTTEEVFSYQGTYSFGNKKFIGVVDFKGVETNGSLKFVISIGSSKGCTSSLRGSAKFTEPGVATYRDSTSGCNLTFMFANNKLEVKENKCKLFHGATCQFHGTFSKE
jgi:hypothetical protein